MKSVQSKSYSQIGITLENLNKTNVFHINKYYTINCSYSVRIQMWNKMKFVLQNTLVGTQIFSLIPDKQGYQIHISSRPLTKAKVLCLPICMSGKFTLWYDHRLHWCSDCMHYFFLQQLSYAYIFLFFQEYLSKTCDFRKTQISHIMIPFNLISHPFKTHIPLVNLCISHS